MGILWTIIVGFIVGVIAKFVMPGRDGGGIVMTTILGVVGAVVGTYLGSALGLYRVGESAGLIASVLGAMLVLFLFRMVKSRA